MADMMEHNMTDSMEHNMTDIMEHGMTDIMEKTGRLDLSSEMVSSVATFLGNLGHFGQISVVWFSIGIAVWQMLAIGRNLITAGKKLRVKIYLAKNFIENIDKIADIIVCCN